MTIASSDIFFVVAGSGTGKTFTGDYLEHVHNFAHVDGDMQLRNMHIPKYRENCQGLIEASKNKDDPDGVLWQPYFQELVDQTLKAAITFDKVVLTFACSEQKHRDFVMTKLKEGGADNPTMVFLTINEDVKLEGLYHRSKRQVEAAGMTLSGWMKSKGWEGEGEPSIEDFKLCYKQLTEESEKGDGIKFDDPPSYATVVDVTSRDITSMDATEKVFGVTRNPDLSYESIVNEVLEMDRKRDEETPYDMEEWEEIEKELKEKTEAEREQIKKRRSSLMSVERKLGLTRLSASSGDGKLKARRQSLIMTGKIELE